MYRILVILLILLYAFSSNTEASEIDNIMEEILNNGDLDGSVENYIEILEFYNDNKIILKHATIEEIDDLPLISIDIANTIYNEIRNDKINSINDLKKMKILDKLQLSIIKYCTQFDKKINNYSKYRLRNITPLYNEKGVQTNKYLGDKNISTQNIIANYNDFSIDFSTKKGKGERLFVEQISGSIKYNYKSFKILFGDYNFISGINSLISTPFNLKKGFDFVNLYDIKNPRFITNKSFYSNKFLRGGIIQDKLYLGNNNYLKYSLFYSNKGKSAGLDKDNNIISSITKFEEFYSDNKIEKQNKLNETLYGLNLHYADSKFNFGANLLYLKYNYNISTSSNSDFQGKEGLLSSMYGDYSFWKSTLSAELSADNNNNYGLKIAVKSKLDKNFNHLISFRNFDTKLSLPFSNNEGEFSSMANEIGLYNGFILKVNKLKISTYFDYYQSKTRTYFIPAIVKGTDFLTKISYNFKNSDIILKYKNENKTDNSYQDSSFIHQKLISRLNLKYILHPSKSSSIKFEAEAVSMAINNMNKSESGYMFGIEYKYVLFKDLEIKVSDYYYNTNSYESGIWKYEYYFPYYSRIPKFNGIGNSVMINIKYNFTKYIKIWTVYKNDYLFNKSEWGSGNTLIYSPQKDLFYFQLELKI